MILMMASAVVSIATAQPPVDVATCLVERAAKTMWITPAVIATADGITLIYGHGVKSIKITATTIETKTGFGQVPHRELQRCASGD